MELTKPQIDNLKFTIDTIFEDGPNKKVALSRIIRYIERLDNPIMKAGSKIEQLEQILTKRLVFIDRWRKVQVIDSGKYFIIEWKEPRDKNIHPFENKVIPKSDLDIIIDRNLKRLENETINYK